MQGLKIKTVTGMEFEVHGAVTYKDFSEARVYYCAGKSWPAEIVQEILMEKTA